MNFRLISYASTRFWLCPGMSSPLKTQTSLFNLRDRPNSGGWRAIRSRLPCPSLTKLCLIRTSIFRDPGILLFFLLKHEEFTANLPFPAGWISVNYGEGFKSFSWLLCSSIPSSVLFKYSIFPFPRNFPGPVSPIAVAINNWSEKRQLSAWKAHFLRANVNRVLLVEPKSGFFSRRCPRGRLSSKFFSLLTYFIRGIFSPGKIFS